jgi:hypothetical protein
MIKSGWSTRLCGVDPVTRGSNVGAFGEMAQQLSAAFGRTITFVDVPPEAMRGALDSFGFPPSQADNPQRKEIQKETAE